ncbi:MAG: hypothetical protein VX371_00470, partial [Verrucomicrobiota bacterium]|nr:hypothetical protein [Verrucomicrobiota bacterium]
MSSVWKFGKVDHYGCHVLRLQNRSAVFRARWTGPLGKDFRIYLSRRDVGDANHIFSFLFTNSTSPSAPTTPPQSTLVLAQSADDGAPVETLGEGGCITLGGSLEAAWRR